MQQYKTEYDNLESNINNLLEDVPPSESKKLDDTELDIE